MNRRSKSLAATASLILAIGLGAFAPAQAKPCIRADRGGNLATDSAKPTLRERSNDKLMS
jgi:hypothetical protein